MRADARRNRDRILDATIELVLEVGGEPTRDAVAARAGVGIATLYRHFPDQQALLRAAALHVLDRSITAGEAALATAAGPAEALRQYLHHAVDVGLGAFGLLHPLLEGHTWPDHRARASALLTAMVEGGQRAGHLRPDVTVEDLGFAMVRVCRPLALGIGNAAERAVAHRHLDLFLDGLSTARADSSLPESDG